MFGLHDTNFVGLLTEIPQHGQPIQKPAGDCNRVNSTAKSKSFDSRKLLLTRLLGSMWLV